MIHPFVKMTIYGVVYYQGETNSISKVNDYSCMFPGLIDAYRANWYEGTEANTRMDFPFGFVQVRFLIQTQHKGRCREAARYT